MRYGIQLASPGAYDAPALARAAEEAGLDDAFVAATGFYVAVPDLIAATSRVRIGTGIIPLFHGTPFMHAATALQLQKMAHGRFVLGVGSQTKGQVRRMAGITIDHPAMRSRDMIRAIRALMAGDTYEGEYYSSDPPGGFGLEPGDEPPPLIYHSGVNPLNLRVAGEVADGLVGHPIFTARYLDEVVGPQVADGLARAGRERSEFDLVVAPMVWVVDAEHPYEQGASVARRALSFYFSTRAYGGFMSVHGWDAEREAIRGVWERAQAQGRRVDPAEMEAIIPDAMVDEGCLVGTAAELRDMLRDRFEGRADTVLLYSLHDSYLRGQAEGGVSGANFLRAIEAVAPLAVVERRATP
jgi:probable F420-dependent oxidoreductase